MAESRTKNASRNILFGMLSKVVMLLLPFVTRTLLLYLMGVSSVGASTLFTSILSFLSLAELGFGSAVVYSMYKPVAENDTKAIGTLLNYYKWLYRVIGLVILTLGVALMPLLPYLTKKEAPTGINMYLLYSIYLVNSVVSYFFAGYRQSLLIAHQRADIRDKISIVVTILVRFVEIAVIVLTRNLYLYAAAAVFGTMVTNLLTALVTKKKYPEIRCEGRLDSDKRKAIRKKLGGLFGTKMNSIIVHQADTLVISGFLGLTVLTEYGNYYYILNAVAGFVMIFFNSLTASVGNKITKDNDASVFQLFRKINLINTWIVGWCAISMMCLFQPFMKLWVGEKLMLPLLTAFFMSMYFYIYQIQRTLLVFKDAAGLWYEDRFRPYVSMVLNLASNLIMVQIIGLNGIVLSTILAFLISIPWCNYVVFRNLFHKKAMGNLLRMVGDFLATLAIGAGCYFLCGLCGDGFLWLAVRCGICLLVPNAAFALLYCSRPEFAELKEMVGSIVRRKRERA